MWLHAQAATARQTVVFKMSQGSRLFRPKKEPLDKDRRKKKFNRISLHESRSLPLSNHLLGKVTRNPQISIHSVFTVYYGHAQKSKVWVAQCMHSPHSQMRRCSAFLSQPLWHSVNKLPFPNLHFSVCVLFLVSPLSKESSSVLEEGLILPGKRTLCCPSWTKYRFWRSFLQSWSVVLRSTGMNT